MNGSTLTCEEETRYLWWVIRSLADAHKRGDKADIRDHAEMLEVTAKFSSRPAIRSVASKALAAQYKPQPATVTTLPLRLSSLARPALVDVKANAGV